MRKQLTMAGLVVGAIIGGFGVGVGVAATGDGDDAAKVVASEVAVEKLVASGNYEGELDPYVVLPNGKTAGNYRLDTPLGERPDFVPILLDGKKGYLKIEDFDPTPIVVAQALETARKEGGSGPHRLPNAAAAQLHERVAGATEPNARGEVWAPVYDQDGETVIGKKLMNTEE